MPGPWRTKLPNRGLVKIYALVFINMFANEFSITMVFPYLPFLTEFLIPGLQEDERDVGKYVGFIAGSMFVGRIFGSYFWGILADRKGRKTVLVASTICMGLSTVMFGFSVNFAMAVVSRFLLGLTNGVVSVSKAVISEVSDDSNQAIGITLVGTAFGTGYILGPAVAGAIADPVGQYNLTITNSFLRSFLTTFPFSLPPIFGALVFMLSTILTILFLPETLGMKKNQKRSEIDQIDSTVTPSQVGVSDGVDQSQNGDQTSLCEEEEGTDETRLLGGEESDDSESRTSDPSTVTTNFDGANGSVTVVSHEEVLSGRGELVVEGVEEGRQWSRGGERSAVLHSKETRCDQCFSTFLTTVKKSLRDLRLFFRDGASLNCLLIYCVYSFGVISFNEIFSLWAYTDPHLGGLGFSLHEIGTCLTIVGVLMFPIALLAFPLFEKWLQTIKTYFLVAISGTALVLVLPHVHYLFSHRPVLWVILVTLSVLANGCFTVGFSAIFMLINNSVTFDKLGSINGVAVMMSSGTRAVAPVIAGSLFSASLYDATLTFGFPVNYNLVFVVLSIVFMVTVFMVACLPVSINKQKIIEDQ